MTAKFNYGNSVIVYEVVKSKRSKTSQITVDTSGVTVRIPQTKTADHARKIVKAKAQWIFKKQLYYKEQKQEKSKITFAKGSKIPFRGKIYSIRIIPNSQEKVKVSGKFMEFHIKQKRHTTKQISQMYQRWLEAKAEKIFSRAVKKFAERLSVKPRKIVVKQLKGRWGSATEQRQINLNSNLLKAPQSVINYVVLHELCHLKIKEHSDRFWNLLSKHMPNYEKQLKWLETNGITIS